MNLEPASLLNQQQYRSRCQYCCLGAI